MHFYSGPPMHFLSGVDSLRRNTGEPRRRKVQPINKGVNEPHRVVSADIVVYRLRQKQRLAAVVTGDVRHAGFYRANRRGGIHSVRVFTRSA
jgi:hypothetical protein